MRTRAFLNVSVCMVLCRLSLAAGEDLYDETVVPVLQ